MAIKTRSLRSAATRAGRVVVAKSLTEALAQKKQTAFLCHSHRDQELATRNSTESRWCPWEIGYADAVKDYERILIVPTEDDSGNWYGNEYLQLYKKIDEGTNKQTGESGYAVFEAGSNSGT